MPYVYTYGTGPCAYTALISSDDGSIDNLNPRAYATTGALLLTNTTTAGPHLTNAYAHPTAISTHRC